MTPEHETRPDHFSRIFGEPALLKGECRKAYNSLRTEIANLLEAEDDVLSQLRVQEVTDSIWEGRRFKRLGTQTIATAVVAALQYLLQPAAAVLKSNPALMAYDYYHGAAKDQKTVKDLVAALGITDEQILGQAIAMSAEFKLFDQLVEGREARRKSLLKEHGRQIRLAEKRKAAEGAQVEPVRVNDNIAAANNPAPANHPAPAKKDAA